MNVEPIGILVALASIYSMAVGLNIGAYLLCVSTLLGAAAALTLPGLGGASIQPAHFALVFLTLGVALRPRSLRAALSSLAYPGPGFWFALFTFYSVLSAVFLPRIFEGRTIVYSIARDADIPGIVAMPLSPQTGNVTQAIYMLGGLACFAIVGGFGRLGGSAVFARALVVTAALCVFFAIADLATFLTDTTELLSIVRNANYRMLNDGEIGDFKRIVGSFPEASTYGYTALALFAFVIMLNLESFPIRHTGLIAAALATTLVLCTSTTAYFAGTITVVIVLAYCVAQVFQRQATARHLKFIAMCLIVIPLMAVIVRLIPAAWESASNLIDATLTTKLESQSGLERMRWNALALNAFFDTSGMGAGLGSVRASSFFVALLASVGIPGAVLYCLFWGSLLQAVLRRDASGRRSERAIGLAALLACIAQVIAASVSGAAIDLGLLFCIAAGLATAYALGPLSEAGAAANEDIYRFPATRGSDFAQFASRISLRGSFLRLPSSTALRGRGALLAPQQGTRRHV